MTKPKRWDENEQQTAIDLRASGASYQEVADTLVEAGFAKRSAESIRKCIARVKGRLTNTLGSLALRDTPLSVSCAADLEDDHMMALEQLHQLREHLLCEGVKRYAKIGKPKNANRKILTISDLHILMHNTDVIQAAIRDHGDADALVINGDFLDMHSVAKWPRRREILLKHEYEIALEMLKTFSDMFPKVFLIQGNHEYRLSSYFASHVDPVVSFMTNDDILGRLAKGYAFDAQGDPYQKYDFPNVVYSQQQKWWLQIGKTIFVHPIRYYSKVKMRTTTVAIEYFLDRLNRDMGQDFQCVVMSHTHKVGQILHKSRLGIEQGCCCVPLEYEAQGDFKYGPQSFGYAVIYMDEEGNVDFDKSGPVYYGTGWETKKPIDISEL